MDKKSYIQAVTDQIRCKQALLLVTKELEDHIEDQKMEYIANGMEEVEAQAEAIRDMGDPIEVGIEMDRIHRPKMAWKMIGLIGALNVAGILLMYVTRMYALKDAGNNPAGVEWIASATGGNIDYPRMLLWTAVGFLCMLGICYIDYSRIGKWAKLLAGGWIVIMCTAVFGMAVYMNGAAYGIPFLFGKVLPLRPFLYLIVPLYGAVLYNMRKEQMGYGGIIKALLWQILPVWIILHIPNLSMALSVEFTFLILLSAAIRKGWFTVNKKRALIILWGSTLILPVVAVTILVGMGYVKSYQAARIFAFIHPEKNDGTFRETIRSITSGAHLAGRGDCDNVWFFHRDYMLTFIIHYYGILAAAIVIGIVGGILIWFLKKTGKQKNQLGMIMGTGCVTVLLIQFAGYVLENLGYLPISNNYCMFLTTGGSGMMISYFMFGILLSIYRYQNVLAEPQIKCKRNKIRS